MSGDIRLPYLHQRCSQMPRGTSFSLLDASVSLSLCLSHTYVRHTHMHTQYVCSPLCGCILIYLPLIVTRIFLDQSEWEGCRREGPVMPLQPGFPIKQLYYETIQLKVAELHLKYKRKISVYVKEWDPWPCCVYCVLCKAWSFLHGAVSNNQSRPRDQIHLVSSKQKSVWV